MHSLTSALFEAPQPDIATWCAVSYSSLVSVCPVKWHYTLLRTSGCVCAPHFYANKWVCVRRTPHFYAKVLVAGGGPNNLIVLRRVDEYPC